MFPAQVLSHKEAFLNLCYMKFTLVLRPGDPVALGWRMALHASWDSQVPV